MRKVLSVSMFLLLAGSLAAAGFTATVIADGGLRLRRTAGADGAQLALLPKGSTVRVLDDAFATGTGQPGAYLHWARVTAGGRTGWVALRYLRPAAGLKIYDNSRSYTGGWPALLLLHADGRAVFFINMCQGFSRGDGRWVRQGTRILTRFPGGKEYPFEEQPDGTLKFAAPSVGCCPNEGDIFAAW